MKGNKDCMFEYRHNGFMRRCFGSTWGYVFFYTVLILSELGFSCHLLRPDISDQVYHHFQKKIAKLYLNENHRNDDLIEPIVSAAVDQESVQPLEEKNLLPDSLNVVSAKINWRDIEDVDIKSKDLAKASVNSRVIRNKSILSKDLANSIKVNHLTVDDFLQTGNNKSTHGLKTQGDLLVSDKLEIDGQAFFDSNITVNGTANLSQLDVRGGLSAGANGTEWVISANGVVTAGAWNGSVIGTAYLNNSVMTEGENISLLNNNSGYISDGNTNWNNSYGFITASSAETLTNKTWNGNTIDVAYGGTGATTFSANYLLKGNTTSAITSSIIYDDGTNVAIGTTSPTANLHIDATATTNDALLIDAQSVTSGSALKLKNSTATMTDAGRILSLVNQTDTELIGVNKWGMTSMRVSNNYTASLNVGTGWDDTIGLIVQGYSPTQSANLQEWRGSDETVLAAMTATGSLGIGTNNPGAKLHVANSDSSTTDINPALLIQNPYNSIDTTAGIMFGLSSNANYVKQAIFAKYTDAQFGVGELHFAVNGNWNSSKVSIADSKMMINKSGNVGIGTTSPSYKLDLRETAAGFAAQISNSSSSGSGLYIAAGNDSSHRPLRIDPYNGVWRLFYIGGDGSGYLAAASWTYGSDRRMKENISYLDDQNTNALSIINGLKPATFDYIHGSKNQVGFIAQDMQEVLPGLVTQGDDGMLGIRTEGVIPYLVKGIQQQQLHIETQDDSISSLDIRSNETINTVSELQDYIDNKLLLINNEQQLQDDKAAQIEAEITELTATVGTINNSMSLVINQLDDHEQRIAALEQVVTTGAGGEVIALSETMTKWSDKLSSLTQENETIGFTLDGNLKVKELESDKIKTNTVIAGIYTVKEDDNDLIGQGKTTGAAIILAGDQDVFVENTNVKNGAKIIVTPIGNVPMVWIVSEKKEEEGFRIRLDKPAETDAKFDYWIVQTQ